MAADQTQILGLAESQPDEIVLSDDLGNTLTRAELVDRATRIGRGLASSHGVGPGDHIGLLTDNRTELFEIYLAAILAGFWFVPINGLLSAEEVAYICRDASVKVVIAEPDKSHLVPDGIPVTEMGQSLDRLARDADSTPFPLDGPAGSRFSYTSGTTGRPKGVKRSIPGTVREMLDLQARLGRQVGLDGRGTHLVTGPAYHAAPGGYGFFDLCNGADLVLMRRFDSARTLDLIESLNVRHTHLVPTMMVRMLRLPDDRRERFHAPELRVVLHGAAPISPTVKSRMIEWFGPILTEYWGTSEAGTFTRVDSADWLDHPGTVGRPVEGFEVFAVSDNGERLPPDEVGVLYCHTPGRDHPFEYWNSPEKTEAAYLRPGVFSLGDMGSVDPDGWVRLADRATNMIITGGVNVYPAEVEQVLIEHPAVIDAAVFGIPDAEWGEQVKAAIELVPGADPGDLSAEILAFAARKLGRYKVPRSIDIHETLPRQPNGKLYVGQLKSPYWQGHDRQI